MISHHTHMSSHQDLKKKKRGMEKQPTEDKQNQVMIN